MNRVYRFVRWTFKFYYERDGNMGKYTIGIDVGGTKTAYGIFDENKKLITTLRQSSDSELPPEAFFDKIAVTIIDLCNGQNITIDDLRGVGIGMPSYILYEEGRIIKTVNLTKIKEFSARAYLMNKLGGNVRVILDNDSHTGALAEYRHGAGRGFRHMIYCPLSTGISSGIIIEGELFRGKYGWSGESGHMIVTPGQGIECGCGNKGCLMSWCSGSMIAKHVQSWIEDGQETIMKTLTDDPKKLTAMHIDEAYLKNDAMAIRAVEQMVRYIAIWIYNLYVTLNINCFVFGGGLLKMNVRLLERVRKAFDEYNRNDMPVYFKTAELGEHFGIVGAAELLY